MGNNETWVLILGTARALRRSAADLRESPEAKKLGEFLRSNQALDDDDRQALADLITGNINRARGARGPAYKSLRPAVRAAREMRRKDKSITLEAASEAVASTFKVPPSTVFNELRRSSKASAKGRNK